MKILKYRLMTEVNHGTEDNPNIVQTFKDCVVKCKNGTFDDAYALSLSEAYNGEVTVEDIPMTAEEARAKRDKLLSDTDWTQTLDAPIDETTRTAYRVYRQALRDIPQQDGFPLDIIWPELPAKVKAAPEPVDEAVDLLLSGATGEEASA